MSAHPLETYLSDCYSVRVTGANAPETSFYPALSTLLNEVGRHLKPKVRRVMGLKDQGAGMPDKGNTSPIKHESFGKKRPRKDVSISRDLLRQPIKGCRSYSRITRGVEHTVLDDDSHSRSLSEEDKSERRLLRWTRNNPRSGLYVLQALIEAQNPNFQ